MNLFDKIHNLQGINTISKHEQIVHGIIDAIDDGVIKVGDKLPSINEMVAELGYARKTIVKSYTELKERGLVESKNLKGYFIISQETNVTVKVALVLFAFHNFQEDFYNTFRKELGKKYQIDVFFHHNNLSLFQTIMDNISRKYGMYVVAPIPDVSVLPMLKTIPPDKLLLVDRFLKMPKTYSYITQEFEQATYEKLTELLPAMENYKKFILFYRYDADYPIGILNAFNTFIKDYKINGEVKDIYEPNSLQKGNAYFFISDTHLWEVLRDSMKKGYTAGREIGILAHDDNIIKEIAFGGITTISTDFKLMATKAAKFVKKRNEIREIIPSSLIQRNSL